MKVAARYLRLGQPLKPSVLQQNAAPAKPVKRSEGSLRKRRSDATAAQRRDAFLLLWKEGTSYVAPETEHRFAPPRRWMFDFAWPSYRIALESEGGVWIQGAHNRGAKFLLDMEKYNEAAIRDWIVLRVPSNTLVSRATLELVLRAITR